MELLSRAEDCVQFSAIIGNKFVTQTIHSVSAVIPYPEEGCVLIKSLPKAYSCHQVKIYAPYQLKFFRNGTCKDENCPFLFVKAMEKKVQDGKIQELPKDALSFLEMHTSIVLHGLAVPQTEKDDLLLISHYLIENKVKDYVVLTHHDFVNIRFNMSVSKSGKFNFLPEETYHLLGYVPHVDKHLPPNSSPKPRAEKVLN